MTLTYSGPSGTGSRPDSLRLVFDPTGADLQAAVDCEADVFGDRYGDSREDLHEAFAEHERDTVWLALIDASGVAVAAARMIVPSDRPLKWQVYVAGEPWSLDAGAAMAAVGLDPLTTWDVASLSVRRRSRGASALWTAGLCHGLFQLVRVNDVSATVAVMDEGARDLLAANGIIYTTFPGAVTAPFYGSPASTPVYADMQAMVVHQRRHFPDAYRLVTLGIGLDGIDLPGVAEFELRRRTVDLAAVPEQPTQPDLVDVTAR